MGELRVSMRTQNRALVLALSRFYELWAGVEQAYFGTVEFRAEDGKYVRRLYLAEGGEHKSLGDYIAAYIRTFDTALKLYFSHIDEPRTALREIERTLRAYLQSGGAIR